MTAYQARKEKARAAAIEWQTSASERVDSYGGIAAAQALFEKLGRQYGLLREFRENGVI